jgi:hypothetical protein
MNLERKTKKHSLYLFNIVAVHQVRMYRIFFVFTLGGMGVWASQHVASEALFQF